MYSWKGKKVVVLGGDERELEIIRNLLLSGSIVQTYGVVPNEDYDSLQASNYLEAASGADIIIAPVPGVGENDALYAPSSQESLVINPDFFKHVNRGAVYFSGTATDTIRKAGDAFDIQFFDLKDDDYLQVLHAIPTAEGAISVTVQNTKETIHNSNALVIGYGRIASLLANNLKGMGAKVTVAARKPESRIRAYANGFQTLDVKQEELSTHIHSFNLIYNTVPSLVLSPEVLQKVNPNTLVMDLASPPGGLNHRFGEELGLNVIWARGQAGTAPIHSGYAQFLSMVRILDNEYEYETSNR
ncbi:dipicolinate synthase subunit DpsA [Robertmurraya massiliosenegalensis]|uniref:dipicolinate synthase subunit DpsA n=1 Tax=Robertmurraya TaxID=2837507 RepID=UPI0039A46AD4